MTHAVGLYPSEEALKHRPHLVTRVVVHPDIPAHERARIETLTRARNVPLVTDAQHVQARRRHAAAWVVVDAATEHDTLESDHDHLVLVRPAQAGNVGAALRAALGFGVRDVALVDGRVDAWSPHVLRASQGARFALRVAAFPDWTTYRAQHAHHHAFVFAPPKAPATLPVATTELSQLTRPRERACAWVFGPEGGSVPDEVAGAGVGVSIPQHPDLESHNLAVAVGVALYARGSMRVDA